MTELLKKTEQTATLESPAGNWQWCVSSMQEALDKAERPWSDLVLSSGSPPPALPLWNASLYEAFGPMGGSVHVHRLYRDSRLVAVLPLSLADGVHRMLRPYQHASYASLWSFAFDESVSGAAAEICRHLLDTADTVDLKYMPVETGPMPHLIDVVDPSDRCVEGNPEEADTYIDISKPWDESQKQFSRGIRRKMKQCIRRLKEQGELTLSMVECPDDIDATLTECLELEKAGWKGRNGTAIACQPNTECFYRGLARRGSEVGLFAIYTLRLDEKLVAFELAMRSGNRIDSEKIGYDEDFAKFSPGNVVAYLIAERECQDSRFTGYHWGRPTPAKERWARHRNELVRMLMFSPGMRGRCSRIVYTRVRPVVRGCRQILRSSTGDSSE